jgi:hypothetical protein
MVSNLGKENRRVKNNPSRHRDEYGALRSRGAIAGAEHHAVAEFTDHATLRTVRAGHHDATR